MSHDSRERYIGDGVYASLDPAQMIILKTTRAGAGTPLNTVVNWIALEPEVMMELMRFAFDIGWGDLILKFARERVERMQDDEYARDEEDKQRKRDAAEGFPDED